MDRCQAWSPVPSRSPGQTAPAASPAGGAASAYPCLARGTGRAGPACADGSGFNHSERSGGMPLQSVGRYGRVNRNQEKPFRLTAPVLTSWEADNPITGASGNCPSELSDP